MRANPASGGQLRHFGVTYQQRESDENGITKDTPPDSWGSAKRKSLLV